MATSVYTTLYLAYKWLGFFFSFLYLKNYWLTGVYKNKCHAGPAPPRDFAPYLPRWGRLQTGHRWSWPGSGRCPPGSLPRRWEGVAFRPSWTGTAPCRNPPSSSPHHLSTWAEGTGSGKWEPGMAPARMSGSESGARETGVQRGFLEVGRDRGWQRHLEWKGHRWGGYLKRKMIMSNAT